MSGPQTTNPNELPLLAVVPPDFNVFGHSPDGPMQRLPFDRLLAKLIAANVVKPDAASLEADLAHLEHSVALVHSDADPLKNGWYRKLGAAGAGEWVQFEELARSMREAILQTAEQVLAARDLAIATADYASLAEAQADFPGVLTEGKTFSYSVGGLLMRGQIQLGVATALPGPYLAADKIGTPTGETLAARLLRYDASDAFALGLCDGADKAAALAALFTAGLTHLTIPRGRTVRLDTLCAITAPGDIRIDGDGTLDCSGGGRLEIVGSQTALPALSADLARGARQIVFAAAHGLSAGDHIVLHDPTPFSAGLDRDYYQEGWRGLVAEVVNATTIRIDGRLPCSLPSSVTQAYKVTGGRVDVADWKVIPNSTEHPPVLIARRSGVRVDRITVPRGAGYSAFNIVQCHDVQVGDPRSTARAGDAYPVNIASCQPVILHNVTACFSTRHAQAIGGGGALSLPDGNNGNTPSRDVQVNHSILKASGDIGAGDFHGATFNAVFNNCTFDPGAILSGGDLVLNKPRFTDMAGRCVRMTGIEGGYVVFNSPIFETHDVDDVEGVVYFLTNFQRRNVRIEINNPLYIHRGDPTGAYRPLILASSVNGTWDASSGIFPASPAHGAVFEVTGAGTVGGTAWEVGDYAVYSAYGDRFHKSPKPRLDVVIRDGAVTGLTAGMVLVILAGTQVMDARFTLDVDRFTGPGGQYFAASRAEHSANCKMRLPSQENTDSLAITTGASSAFTPFHTLRWEYPRRPMFDASFHLDSDNTADFAAIGQTIAYVTNPRAGQMRAALMRIDGANWASDHTARLTTRVWLNDLEA